MAATFDLDDDLTIDESPWRARVISFAILLLVVAFSAAAVYYFFVREEATVARATEDIPVERKTISATLLISGVADAQLNSDLVFQSSGKVASVNVKIGDEVREGQVLAAMESDDFANNVASAQTSQRTAQLRLQDLLDGSTDADLAAAFQAVETARAALVKAGNDRTELIDGASAADLAAAEQAVESARSQLATAQSNQQQLIDGADDAEVIGAEAAVTAAETALTSAENALASAGNSVVSAAAALKNAQVLYCGADGAPAFCGAYPAPISGADGSYLDGQLAGANASAALTVISSNSAYLNAVNTRDSAEASVDSAENALESAEAKLAALEDGPSSTDRAAVDAAVAAAQASLRAAEEKLADARAGATPEQLATADAAVSSAEASFASAEARYDEALDGPTANAIAQAQEAVRTAALSVVAAEIRLEEAQIIAPFDGTVAAVNITAGEFFGPANVDPAIILLTPDRMHLEMDISESDYQSVEVGQSGVALFDAGGVYPFTISEIGLAPTQNQGVVTYKVKADLVVGASRPSPGMNARGQITTESKPDVLTVPPRAIRNNGQAQVVDARRDGTVQEVVVTTGLSDQNNVEILTGLQDGDIVVAPVLNAGAQNDEDEFEPLPGGVS
ncbi:MAG: biotin/lipoyl-binding protein [Dehalococcoidia bacterium]